MKKTWIMLSVMVILMAWQSHMVDAQENGCQDAQEMYSEGVALSDGSEEEANFYRKAIAACPDYADAHFRLASMLTDW